MKILRYEILLGHSSCKIQNPTFFLLSETYFLSPLSVSWSMQYFRTLELPELRSGFGGQESPDGVSWGSDGPTEYNKVTVLLGGCKRTV